MTDYDDLDGFWQYLQSRYRSSTARTYYWTICKAAELGVSFETLKSLDAREVYNLVRGTPTYSRSTIHHYRGGVSSYEQYLRTKEQK